VREREGISRLSGERVRQEVLRLLAAPRGPELVDLMHDHGLLVLVLHAVPRPAILTRPAAVEAALGIDSDPVLRLAALAVEIAEDADGLQNRLKLSNEEHARLARAAVRLLDVGPPAPEQRAKAILYTHGEHAYRDRVLLAWARSGAVPADNAWRHVVELPSRWQAPRFPLGGSDVMALGVAAGPRVGQVLRTVEDWWIAGEFRADEDMLRAKLKQVAGTH
jgi:poly(A) polymerase